MHSLLVHTPKPVSCLGRRKCSTGLHPRSGCRSAVFAGIRPMLMDVISAVGDGNLAPFDAARSIEETLYPGTLVTRNVFPRVLNGKGKRSEWLCKQIDLLHQEQGRVLVTGVEPVEYATIRKTIHGIQYHAGAKTLKIGVEATQKLPGMAMLISDSSVPAMSMEQLKMLAEFLGCNVHQTDPLSVTTLIDTMLSMKNLRHANVIVTVYDEERALPDVISGLTDIPVIAVRMGDHTQFELPSGCVSAINLLSAAYTAAKVLKSGEQLMASMKAPTEMELITAQAISIDEKVKDALKMLNDEGGDTTSSVLIEQTSGAPNHPNGTKRTADSIM